ncbi:DUF6286 domain-containing Asp23/Gls24 family envelope stress response protein [Streptomyces sp. SGAir0957]
MTAGATVPPGERGRTVITERVVRRVAQRAAAEAGASSVRTGATVDGDRATVTADVCLPYPTALADTADQVRTHITDRTASLTGLRVKPARVRIGELRLDRTRSTVAEDDVWAAVPVKNGPAGAARRSWSPRRLPVTGLLLLAAAACAALLVDVVRVHAAHEAASPWRVKAVDWLGEHGPGSTGALVAGLVAACGIWLLILAVTPGRRGQLPLRTQDADVRAHITRRATAREVERVLQDVPGIGSARTKVRRRRVVVVRARLEFGDPTEARDAALAAARAAAEALSTGRTLRVTVRMTRSPSWQPPGTSVAVSGTSVALPGTAVTGEAKARQESWQETGADHA